MNPELVEAVGRTFNCPTGEVTMEWLRKVTVDVSLNPKEATSEELWHLEGKRDLVKQIQRMIKQWQG